MTKLNLPPGPIIVCNRDEARQLWNDEPTKRGQIWLEDEFMAHINCNLAECNDLYARKMANPGRLLI